MKDELKKAVGNRVKRIRKALGLTQEKMVSFFNIGRANYSRVEKGDVSPRIDILYTLQTKFNVSLDWLVADAGKMFVREKGLKSLKEKSESDNYSGEIADLLLHIEKVPMLKHAVLSHFHEYKTRHKEIIRQFLDESEVNAHEKTEEGKG